ncbi:2-aminoethylphosphonate--pyruvate transaminase [Halobacillus salinarum]|uniref:2-aminoethylphosphonate--pyruvate transaminase n=1 Tax=Halobacillus salinarum TaxID=2932257 RepID=A0ABY4EHD9_9BACI|nr:2-aminoethylphosphonate--pyruvate transaminase [Halobacillus salinarum]UOQ43308.1 2-aminoethylphosphonate--pyruvate transaminase [Halobacillus salinarum]
MKHNDENPYLLLTPGPLTTSLSVREKMLTDWCTWDEDYKSIVQSIRRELLELAAVNKEEYTSVLMQGSGTFSVESVINTVVPQEGKLLVIVNGAYGERMVTISRRLGLQVEPIRFSDTVPPDLHLLHQYLAQDSRITHVAVVHCETTTGMKNPLEEIADIVKKYNKTLIVDAMSSFGGIEFSISDLSIDYMISSANKCIQGVPGFGFVIAKQSCLKKCKDQSRSLALDLYDQWETMEAEKGKWRFTSPTHTVRAFQQALKELKEEGLNQRQKRYQQNQELLVSGMEKLGFTPLLEKRWRSPIITPFYYPEAPDFSFSQFYEKLKSRGFVIYPGKVTKVNTFRIGNIGEVYPSDINKLLRAVEDSMYWKHSRSKGEAQ